MAETELPKVDSRWKMRKDDEATAWRQVNGYVGAYAPFQEVVIVMSNEEAITFRPTKLDDPIAIGLGFQPGDEDFLFTPMFLRQYEEMK